MSGLHDLDMDPAEVWADEIASASAALSMLNYALTGSVLICPAVLCRDHPDLAQAIRLLTAAAGWVSPAEAGELWATLAVLEHEDGQ